MLRDSNAVSTVFYLHRAGLFDWCRKPEYPPQTMELFQDTEILSDKVDSRNHAASGNHTHNFSGDRH